MSFIESLLGIFVLSRKVGGADFERISSEFLLQKKTEMGMDKYIQWLRRENTILGSYLYERKEKNLSIQDNWVEALREIENEFDNLEKETGTTVKFSRMSGDF